MRPTQPTRTRRRRAWLALASSCALAGVLLWAGLSWIAGRDVRAIEIRTLDRSGPARPCAGDELGAVFGELGDPARPEDWVFHLPAHVAERFFGTGNQAAYDPWSYTLMKPMQGKDMPWPEHPLGHVVTSVNSLGCRGAREPAAPPADLRVLVLGDSHTFGVCDDSEVLSAVLERRLSAARAPRTVQVLNASAGGWSFLNYLGAWLRLRAFRPAVVVVVAFAGNDFAEFMALDLHFTGRSWPPRGAHSSARRQPLLPRFPSPMAQGLDSIDCAREWPAERARTVQAAVYVCGELARSARAHGAELVVALLPSPYLLPWPEGTRPGEVAVAALELAPEDFQREAGHAADFLKGLAERGIPAIDLTPALAAERVPPFWRHDLHLSSRGHELAAQALLPLVEARLPR